MHVFVCRICTLLRQYLLLNTCIAMYSCVVFVCVCVCVCLCLCVCVCLCLCVCVCVCLCVCVVLRMYFTETVLALEYLHSYV